MHRHAHGRVIEYILFKAVRHNERESNICIVVYDNTQMNSKVTMSVSKNRAGSLSPGERLAAIVSYFVSSGHSPLPGRREINDKSVMIQ